MLDLRLPSIPDHSDPELRSIPLRSTAILQLAARLYALLGAVAQDVVEGDRRVEFNIGRERYALTDTTVAGWHLAENVLTPNGRRPKRFYFLPTARVMLRIHRGKVPFIEYTDPGAYEQFVAEGGELSTRLYTAGLLASVVQDPRRTITP